MLQGGISIKVREYSSDIGAINFLIARVQNVYWPQIKSLQCKLFLVPRHTVITLSNTELTVGAMKVITLRVH